MIKLNKIYTRTGDTGETGLTDGKRVKKSAARVAAYGTVEEANAVIGLAAGQAKGKAAKDLTRIQNDLFDLGADLSTPGTEAGEMALRISAGQVKWLEKRIDEMNEELKPLKSFVLPGGSPASAHLHLARTVVRRAERLTVALFEKEDINPEALKYLNRLSDYLFQLGRMLNNKGNDDILWVPGENR